MNQTGEVDFLAYLNQREEREKKATELQQQYDAEASIIEEKYAGVLSEYRPALNELNLKIKLFDEKWKPRLADYKKEMKSLNGTYKRMFKEL